METHTLTEEQGKELSGILSSHISHNMPVGEQGQTLLRKLQKVKPNPGQKYTTLFLDKEEEEIFQALLNSHWGRRELCGCGEPGVHKHNDQWCCGGMMCCPTANE